MFSFGFTRLFETGTHISVNYTRKQRTRMMSEDAGFAMIRVSDEHEFSVGNYLAPGPGRMQQNDGFFQLFFCFLSLSDHPKRISWILYTHTLKRRTLTSRKSCWKVNWFRFRTKLSNLMVLQRCVYVFFSVWHARTLQPTTSRCFYA